MTGRLYVRTVCIYLLHGLDHGLALAFLASTYFAWGAGLRVNLTANARLLEQTGTSTNALSKALFDLTRRRSARVHRFAAGAGYVATELVKEAPYYLGAFGAVLVTDSVAATDALVFLGGGSRVPSCIAATRRSMTTGSRPSTWPTTTASSPASRSRRASSSRGRWSRGCCRSTRGIRAHIAGLVRPGGVFLTSALRRCRHYVVGGKRFPCANIDEHDVHAVLAPRFEHTTVEARELAGHAAQGYSGIVLAWAGVRVAVPAN